jgi:hypothetical protein
MEYVYKYVSFKLSNQKTLENILENSIYFNKSTDLKFENDCLILTEQEINSCGIFSTSVSYTNQHLWDKFGYVNSGICIEYDIHKILASTNHLNHNKVVYTLEDNQMSSDLFNLPKKFRKEKEVRFILSNIVREEKRSVPLLENTMTRIFLGIDFFSCHSFISEKLDFFKQINPNIKLVKINDRNSPEKYTTISKNKVLNKLNEISKERESEYVSFPN